jgi:hypothetical protein
VQDLGSFPLRGRFFLAYDVLDVTIRCGQSLSPHRTNVQRFIRTSRSEYPYLFRAGWDLGVLGELVKLFGDSGRDGVHLSTSRLSGSGESLR